MGDKVTFNGAASGVQIQQGSFGVNQVQTNADAGHACDGVLRRIIEASESVEFMEAFGDRADEVRNLANEAALLTDETSDLSKKKEALRSIRTIAEQVGASVFASGITSLISSVL